MRLSFKNSVRRAIVKAAIPAVMIIATPLRLWSTPEDRSYVRTYRGAQDILRPGTEPEAYWKSCALDDPAGHPTSKDAALRGPICMKWMLLWGEYLASEQDENNRLEAKEVERERGRRYLLSAFQLLTKDLQRERGEGLAQQLYIHSQLEIRVNWFLISVEAADTLAVRTTALDYYLTLWKALPRAPTSFEVFKCKFETAEQVKEIYREAIITDQPPSERMVRVLLQFFQDAYQFHREPVPDIAGQGDTQWIPAIIRFGTATTDRGLGYGVFPGERGLRPLSALASTDLLMSLTLLERADAEKLIPEPEAKSRSDAMNKELTALKTAWFQDWIERLRKRRNRYGMVKLHLELRAHYLENGDKAAATREQESICALLGEIGERQEWAKQSVILAEFSVASKEWKSALAILAPVKEILYETAQIESLLLALQYEQAANQALGLPGSSDTWSSKIEAVYKDTATMPDVASSGTPELQAKELKQWLAQPGHLAPSRLAAQVQYANALYAEHEYEQAEQAIDGTLPQLRAGKRKLLEYGALAVLLEIETARGNMGRFYSTLREYEELGSELHGRDWLDNKGLEIAQVLYRLRDLHRAEGILGLQMEGERLDALQQEARWTWSRGAGDAVEPQDLLLQARIDLEFGRSEEAKKRLAPLVNLAADIRTEGGVIDKQQQRVNKRLLLGLAEIDSAVGNNDRALDKAERVLAATAPLEEMGFWATAKLVEARAQLALGRNADEDARTFAELAPHFTEHKELEAAHAIEMEIFLGDYYAARSDSARSVEWLKRGLALAGELGAIDQRIEIHRKLGESAARSGDADAAIDEYRKAVELVESVSTTIPSDLGKVGYRAERNRAITKLAMALYDKYRWSHSQEYLAQMFQAVEFGKSRALAEMVFSSQNTKLENFGLPALRAALPSNAVLLEYYMPEDASNAAFRFVIDGSAIAIETLPISVADLTAKVQELKDDATRSPQFYDEAAFRRKAGALGTILLPKGWTSFEALDREQIFIVPAGILYLFPFSLLTDEHGHFLDENEHIDIAYLPNAALIARAPPQFSNTSRSKAFVNPARDAEQGEFLSSSPELQKEFQQAFRGWGHATLYWQQPFTASKLLAELKDTDNVFLYSHGRFVPEDPTASYVALSDDEGAASALSAADIVNLKIGHGLWVLAACSTGSGQVRSGDEVLGLPRALLQAGASMVVISLWDVDMSTSWQMMTLFYRNIAGGMPVSRALRAAASELRKAGKPPFDWAPFILIGQHGFRK